MGDELDRTNAGLAGWSDPAGRLLKAIENDEFALYCQPILDLQGAERYPMGEVLIRLREEEKALLPPGDFFPVFEHYKMMPQLDRWVVRHALAYLAKGERVRLPSLTVNLSGQTIDDPTFPKFVADQLKSSGVQPRSLLFELDELDTLTRLQTTIGFAHAYREIGGSTMLDGFGRRSASFAAIQKIGVRFVKVDGAVTRNILKSPAAKRKMGALVTISRALHLDLVAEFVEEQDVLVRLKALGVRYAQGFGVCQPVALDSL